MKPFLIILAFAICYLSFGISTAHAQIPGVEGWFCIGTQPGTIWHQIPSSDPFVQDAQIKQEDCGANEQCVGIPPPNDTYFGDVACAKTNQPPPKGIGTGMYTVGASFVQGSQVKIGITSNNNGSIGPICTITADDLKVFGRLTACQVTLQTTCGCNQKHVCHDVAEHGDPLDPTKVTGHHQDCSEIRDCGPNDWHIPPIVNDPVNGNQLGFNSYDSKQCVTEITCTTNAKGTLDMPFRPADNRCWNDATINVVAPSGGQPPPQPTADCQPSTLNLAAPNKDPSKILADSLQDDLDNAQKLAILLPDGVKNELQTACATKNPITGVKDNFLVNFICLFQNVPVLGGLIVNICPKEVNFMNQQTECLTQTTLAVENRTRPPEFHPPAQVQACEIIDFGQPSTIGNKDTSSISTQLGGPQGTYSQDTPSEVIVDTDQTQNLSTEGKTFDGDKRVPDINCRCQQYSGANLLEGISFCNDNSLCPR